MPYFDFAIGLGHDAVSLTNIEDIISDPPHVLPDQLASFLGNVRDEALSGVVHRDGNSPHIWQWDKLTPADKNALILFIFGDFVTASANVTIRTMDETSEFVPSYSRFNATVEKPQPGEHYTVSSGGWIRDFKLPFTTTDASGEFTYEFSSEFVR